MSVRIEGDGVILGTVQKPWVRIFKRVIPGSPLESLSPQ